MTMRPNLLDLNPSPALLKRLESLQFELRKVDTTGLSFSDLLIAHVESIIAVPNRCKKGFIDGGDFSCLFVDGLIQCGVSPSKIKTEVRCKKFEAEIDILVAGQMRDAVAFHLKTSARERWRQAERDCVYFDSPLTEALEMALGDEAINYRRNAMRHYVVMVREHKYTTPEEAQQFCKRKRGSYAFLTGFHSIYERAEMNNLVQELSCAYSLAS
jgi:hypothetical protein